MSSRSRSDKPGRWLDPGVTSAEKDLRQMLDVAARRDADEVALRRVWARLAQVENLVPGEPIGDSSSTSRRRWWMWGACASFAGAGTAVAVMVLLMGHHLKVHPTPAQVSAGPTAGSTARPLRGRGQARVVERFVERIVERPAQDSPPSSASRREQSVLLAPATVRTGRKEILNLSLRGGTTVALSASSELSLDNDERPSVSAGEVRFHVPPQPAGQVFTVVARQYRVAVVGTQFVVRVADTRTSIHVEDGLVDVWGIANNQRLAHIQTGESWTSPAETALRRRVLRHHRLEGLHAPGASRSVAAATGSERSPSRLHAPSSNTLAASLPNVAQRRDQVSDKVSDKVSNEVGTDAEDRGLRTTGEPILPLLRSARPAPTASSKVAKVEVSGTTTGRAGDSARAQRNTAPAQVSQPQSGNAEIVALANQAKAARAAGDSQRAVALYRALSEKGGPAAENAEYELGRVQRDGLDQPLEAISTWRAYRARHPRGLLRIETDISVIETLIGLNDRSGALAEGSDFIRRYPDGERHAEIARLVGDLSRERGEWRAAIEAYDQVLSDGRVKPGFRDDVSFHRSTCLLQNDARLGSEALQAYLRDFPAGRFRAQAQRLFAETSSSGSVQP